MEDPGALRQIRSDHITGSYSHSNNGLTAGQPVNNFYFREDDWKFLAEQFCRSQFLQVFVWILMRKTLMVD